MAFQPLDFIPFDKSASQLNIAQLRCELPRGTSAAAAEQNGLNGNALCAHQAFQAENHCFQSKAKAEWFAEGVPALCCYGKVKATK